MPHSAPRRAKSPLHRRTLPESPRVHPVSNHPLPTKSSAPTARNPNCEASRAVGVGRRPGRNQGPVKVEEAGL
jgi:hypothetical protein